MTNQKTDSLVLEANSTTFSLNEANVELQKTDLLNQKVAEIISNTNDTTTKLPWTDPVVKKRRVMKPKGPVSAETRKKMSVARIGMKLSKEHK